MVHTAELRPVNPMASVLIFQGAESLDSMRQGWGYIFWPFADINRFSMIQVPNGLNVQTAGIIRNQTFFVHIWNMLWIVYSNSDPTCYERKQKHTISIYFYLILSIFLSKGWRLKTARGVLLIFLVCVKVMTLHELHVTVGWRRHCNRHLNLPHSQVKRHAAHAFHHVSDHVLHTRCRTVSPRPHLASPCCATFVSFPATPGGRCHNT